MMRLSKAITALCFLGGFALFGGMVYRVGLSGLLESLRILGPWLLPYVLLRVLPIFLHTAAWAACFSGQRLPLPLWQLALVRQAGNTINQLTPTADLGGEVTKALLLEPVMPREQAMAAVVIEKGGTTLAKMAYLALGTVYLTHYLPLSTELKVSLVLVIGLISLGLIGFIAFQRYGLLSRLVQQLKCLQIGLATLECLSHRLARMDEELVAYYTRHPWRFVRSLGLHFVGYTFDVVKTYILLCLLLGEQAPGLPETAMVTVAVAALDQLFFFVPGRVGTFEGARFVVLSALGVTHVYGLAFGIVARVEQLAWSVFGMLSYALIRRLLPRSIIPREAKASSAS
jgi:uncharacterized protein (TIRG00374 family)